jgi:hypothetical protein
LFAPENEVIMHMQVSPGSMHASIL